jgi:ABC-2 type transport system ATP-binding protein
MIELNQISKQYGKILAVDDLTLRIPKGEIFGFIGPNGAGKTTTIKMMGGILMPTSGSIHICGIPMKEEPEAAKQKIGFIPDRPYLYEKLTGLEFLKFVADLYHMNTGHFKEKALSNLKLFSLIDWHDELIESYSHGMKQRLIMAAAMLHDPEVLIVDEPMVGLDPIGIKLVKDLFKDLAAKGTTVFLSTHTLQVAEDLCHRIGIINKGVLTAVGSPQDLRREYQAMDENLEQIFLRLTINE